MTEQTLKQKIIVIVGPTASGKTSLAVSLGKDLKGEVISADSRQIYKYLDIGTAKITPEEMMGVPHHLIDNVLPEDTYTVTDWVSDTERLIAEIYARGNVPIIAGGTFLYIDTLLGKKVPARVPPNTELRAALEKKTNAELFALLKEKDPERAQVIDKDNPRRLVRALEIIDALGEVPKVTHSDSPYDACIIGLAHDTETLKERIFTRLDERIDAGLVEETKNVLEKYVSEDRLNEIGLEYRIALEYIKRELSEEVMRKKLREKVWQYAKRQLTWLKKMENVHWHNPKEYGEILSEVRGFLGR